MQQLWERSRVQVGKYHVEEASDPLPGTCKIYPQWYFGAFQGRHSPVRWAHLQDSWPRKLPTSTFDEVWGEQSVRLECPLQIIICVWDFNFHLGWTPYTHSGWIGGWKQGLPFHTPLRIVWPYIHNSKTDAAQIKRLVTSKAVPVNSDSDTSSKLPLKNKTSTSVLPARKNRVKNIPKNHVAQIYWVLFNKEGMYECNWKSHSK